MEEENRLSKEEEKEIKERLKNHSQWDISFVKEEWQEKLIKKDYNFFKKLKGANVQVVYDILNPLKIKYIRKARKGRYTIVLEHSNHYDIEVIMRFDIPKKGDIGVITFIKTEIKQQ